MAKKHKPVSIKEYIKTWWGNLTTKQIIFIQIIIFIITVFIMWIIRTAIKFGFPTKDLWDWMELLLVPAALALAGAWFTYTQKNTELKIAKEARQTDRDIAEESRIDDKKIADSTKKVDRRIALARQRQQSFENYLDRMTELLLDRGLCQKDADPQVISLAKALTLNVLKAMESEHNRQIIQFLQNSQLLNTLPILQGANLYGVDLRETNLSEANLHKTDLRDTNLHEADLRKANLCEADLRKVDLHQTDLREAILSNAKLGNADMYHMDLRGINLHGANLYIADLSEADLSEADLSEAFLSGADLRKANLSRTNLRSAFLRNANLRGANLSGATVDGKDQLRRTKSLKGATMPDGRLYEEWILNPDGETDEEE